MNSAHIYIYLNNNTMTGLHHPLWIFNIIPVAIIFSTSIYNQCIIFHDHFSHKKSFLSRLIYEHIIQILSFVQLIFKLYTVVYDKPSICKYHVVFQNIFC